jgi:hypothetical protein
MINRIENVTEIIYNVLKQNTARWNSITGGFPYEEIVCYSFGPDDGVRPDELCKRR